MKKSSFTFVIILPLLFINVRCFPPRIGGDGKLSIVGKYNVDMAYGFDIDNDCAYLGTNDGLLILDIRNREKPVKLSELKLGFIRNVNVVGECAYLSGGGNGFIIVDVANAKQPKLIGKYNNGGEIYGFVKSGSYAYLCDRLRGIQVVDIEDPGNIKEVEKWSNDGRYWGIGIKDQIAYVADSKNGLEILDISDPISPRLIDIVPDTKGVNGVQIADNMLCLGTFSGVIKEFDISNSKIPKLILSTTFDTQEIQNKHIFKNLLFAGIYSNSSGIGGISVFDITNPNEPAKLAIWTIKGGVHGIICDGQYVYTAKKGFYILKLKN